MQPNFQMPLSNPSTPSWLRTQTVALNNELNNELDDLLRREAELQARKATLLELQQIQSEEERIRERIRALQEQSGGSGTWQNRTV